MELHTIDTPNRSRMRRMAAVLMHADSPIRGIGLLAAGSAVLSAAAVVSLGGAPQPTNSIEASSQIRIAILYPHTPLSKSTDPINR